jgi:hypothetical protein
MAAKKSPLSGYNHNLKYKNRVYHVQTEDSGRDNPHIFTHLFHDGTILNSSRSEYSDIISDSDWETQLRAKMQNQHKDMMKGLIKGTFNDKIVGFFGLLEAEVAEELPMATLPPPPKRERSQSGNVAAAQTPPPAKRPASQAPWQPPAPTQAPAPNPAGGVMAMPMVMVGDLPPPPAQPPVAQPPVAQPPVAQPPVTQAPPPPTQQPPSDLGAVFAAVPAEAKNVPDSIFGSELISEKSLDEVILAYLSEDMTEE